MSDEKKEMINLCDGLCNPVAKKISTLLPQRIFFWLFGGLTFFVVIVIGGFQWKLLEKINEINTTTLLTNQKVEQTNIRLLDHMDLAKEGFISHEREIDDLEQRFYEFGINHKQKKEAKE
jgi:hypothetical protein